MATAQQKKNGSVTHSSMSARLLELAAETDTPDPYPITETLVIQPLTRARRKAMNEAELKMFVLKQLLAQGMSAAAAKEPELPADPTGEQQAAHDAWAAARADAEEKVDGYNTQHAEAQDDYERAFFGPVYDKVIEYFEDKPLLWDKFIPDIQSQFLPAAPYDGKCPECGRIDPEQAGKALESST